MKTLIFVKILFILLILPTGCINYEKLADDIGEEFDTSDGIIEQTTAINDFHISSTIKEIESSINDWNTKSTAKETKAAEGAITNEALSEEVTTEEVTTEEVAFPICPGIPPMLRINGIKGIFELRDLLNADESVVYEYLRANTAYPGLRSKADLRELLERIDNIYIPFRDTEITGIYLYPDTMVLIILYESDEANYVFRIFVDSFSEINSRLGIENQAIKLLISESDSCRIYVAPSNTQQNYFLLNIQGSCMRIQYMNKTKKETDERALENILKLFKFSKMKDLKPDEYGEVISDSFIYLDYHNFR